MGYYRAIRLTPHQRETLLMLHEGDKLRFAAPSTTAALQRKGLITWVAGENGISHRWELTAAGIREATRPIRRSPLDPRPINVIG